MNLLIYFLSYYIIIISVIGYGFLFRLPIRNSNLRQKINIGYTGILGVFLLIIYSYFSSLFIAHNFFHNSIVILFGLILFLINLKKLFKENKKEYLIFFTIFLLLFVAALAYKTNEDFPYYHFKYIMLLTERPSFLGAGTFNHGFRTPSSIFYLNSLFYLPYINFYSFHFGALLIMGFSNLILINYIKKFYLNEKYNFINYLSLLSFIFINVVFYRIAEHGTDRSAQILVLLIIIEILFLLNFFDQYRYRDKLNKILILVALTLSLKAFYILYIIFILYLIFYISKKISLLKILKDSFLYFIFFTVMIFLVLLINLKNSGCVLYPVIFTCFLDLPWSFNIEELSRMAIHYENWAKGGAGPGFKVNIDPAIYIQNFNWLGNWLKVYFAEKGINTLGGILTISLIVYVIFASKNKKENKNINYRFTYFLILLLFIEWFSKHPSLRYGGFCLWALIIFIPLSVNLHKHQSIKYKKKIYSLILISLLIFFVRNIKRINSEIEQYNYQPIKYAFYNIDKKDLNGFHLINDNVNKLINDYNECKNTDNKTNSYCIKIEDQVGYFFGKYYITRK